MPDIFVAKKKKESGTKTQKAPEAKPKEKPARVLSILKEVTTNPLAAFMANPRGLRFETQDSQEKVILLLRRHFFTNFGWILMSVLLVLSPPFIFPFLPLDFLPDRFNLIVLLSWYLATFSFAFTRFIGWFFNVNIITDERIIDIDFPTLLYKDMTEAKIDQIQDVNTKVGGFARSLFNFGDVLIQTASAVPEIRFEAVPEPERVAKVINEMKLEEEQEKIEGRVR